MGNPSEAARYRVGKAWTRAAVMSWVEPGSTGAVHIGTPVWSVRTFTLPPKALCLPDYHRLLPVSVRAATRSVRNKVPSRHTKGSGLLDVFRTVLVLRFRPPWPRNSCSISLGVRYPRFAITFAGRFERTTH